MVEIIYYLLLTLSFGLTIMFLFNPYILILFFHDDKDSEFVFVLMFSSIIISFINNTYDGCSIILLLGLLLTQKYIKFIPNLKRYTFIIRMLLILNLIDFFIKW